MIIVYPAIFHHEDNSYWVEFPDLEGCQSYGDTINDTMLMAQEALGLYAADLIEKNKPIPNPSDISALGTQENSFTTLVSVDVNSYRRNTKAVKKTLSVPAWLNEEAEKQHINFSSVLQEALKQELSVK